MGSIKVKLRQGEGTTQNIYFHFNYGRKKQYRYAIGLSVKKIGHWNTETNTVKATLYDEIIIERTEWGNRTKIKFKKYKLLSNHTARQSFCTNAYKADMPVIDIMALSGHTSEKVFYSFIKASPLERLEKIAEHSFFK